jgi:hypothetical protein
MRDETQFSAIDAPIMRPLAARAFLRARPLQRRESRDFRREAIQPRLMSPHFLNFGRLDF